MKFDESGWLDVAVEVDVLDNSMPRNGYKPTHIVLHATAGGTDATAIGKYFQSTVGGSNPVSSHFIIGQDGTIVQCVPIAQAAWANGLLDNPRFAFPPGVNPNYYTISIEHCKPSTDNSDSLTDAQAQASFQLVQAICDQYSIPKRAGDASGGIISHADLDSVSRARCPGPYPWDELWAFLKGGANMLDLNDPVVSRYFTDGGNGTWKVKSTGVILQGAILIFYRANNGLFYFGLPLANEDYSVRSGSSDMSAYVKCERAGLMYDPDRRHDNPPIDGPVYTIHVEQDPRVTVPQMQFANAQKSIAALQQQIQLLQSNSKLNDLETRMKQINTLSAF